MTIFPKRRHHAPLTFYLSPAGLAALVILVVTFRPFFAGVAWRVLTPVIALRNSLGVGEVAALRAELASTSAALADRNFLYQENLSLKARLGRDLSAPAGAGTTVVLAGVLQRPPWTPYDTLLIDAGSAQGIQQDDLVSAGGSALIGKISDVYAGTARVTLFSAPGEGHQALLNGSMAISLEGQGGGSMRAEVPRGTAVAVGDPVHFPGIGTGITGQVAAIDAKEGDSFVTIYLHVPADIFSLRYVEVLK
jgi:cell shape-determining protein MreC